MEEPKISQIEKLIEHFRQTDREHELNETLKDIGIAKDPTEVINPQTHEFSEQALILQKNAEREGIKIPFPQRLRNYKRHLKKWYVRYLLYYLAIFFSVFIILNLPLVFQRNAGVDNTKSKIITVSEIQKAVIAPSAPLDPGEIVPTENQIIIPKINVTAPIIATNSRDEKTIQQDLTQGVVHYAGTAYPGEIGNSFITGHSSNYWWIKGNYNYIFLNLDKLNEGDQAKIYYNGNKFIYSVTDKKVIDPNDVSVLKNTDTPTLTLMTCTPPGTNWRRLIVKFNQVSPKYEKPKLVTKQILSQPANLPSTDSNFGSLLGYFWTGLKNLFSLNN